MKNAKDGARRMDPLDRLDEALRSLINRPVSRAAGALLALICYALGCVCAGLLLRGAGLGLAGLLFAGLPALVYGLLAMRILRGRSALEALLTLAMCALMLLARMTFYRQVSSDFEIYLSPWMERFGAQSFASSMREGVGDYNILYQYILFLLARLPMPALFAVKTVSVTGDMLLADAVSHLAGEEGKPSLPAFLLALLLPGVVLNGGMFAQCDSLYAACALWGLVLALRGKPRFSAVCFALSLAFKLQACFLLPIVCVLWADRRLSVKDLLVFALALALTAVPALLGGKGAAQILSIYLGQAGQYTALNYGAPNLFAIIETAGLDVYAYGWFGIALAAAACLALVAFGMRRAGRLNRDGYVLLAFLLALLVVFFLPRMHERYFYLAEPLALSLAVRNRRRAPIAALVSLATLSAYWQTAIALPAAALMMMTAGILALMDTKNTLTDTGNMV